MESIWPRANCASVCPCAAARLYSRRASTRSFGPPIPTKCILARMNCASVCPCAAARLYSRRAST
eukprot:1267335-Prymnesium_polylepis.1